MKKYDHIPTQPGVYLHKNSRGDIIYVGKAKNLRRRVSSYFQKKDHDPKTKLLVSNIALTDTIVTSNELEALLLENRLIKKHRPQYNIQLKDTARYQYVRITKEKFPQVLIARKTNNKDTFIGPFTFSLREIPKIARESFGVRHCSGSFKKPCLYYNLGLCSGVCAGVISVEEYAQNIKDFIRFLKHGAQEFIDAYHQCMQEAAQRQDFEKAMRYKRRIDILEQFKQKQVVDKVSSHDQDIIGIASVADKSWLSIISVKRGVICQKRDFSFIASDDLLSEFLKAYYSRYRVPHEIIVEGDFDPIIVDYLTNQAGRSVTITRPQRGDKKELLALAKKNAYAHFKLEDPVLIELKEMLDLSTIPITIDCFDISNYGEKIIVGACVQFKNRQPYKSGYRVYNIQGDFGQDDFRSMHETLKRRYAKMPLPDLIIIDGGLQQVSFAQKALDDLGLSCAMVGLAKQEETIIFPDGKRLVLNRKKEASKLIIQMRDAVHNFSLTQSRTQYKKHYKHSELDDIVGIGPKTKFLLLHEFGSLEAIKKASKEELSEVVGAQKAQMIYDTFNTT